MMKVLYARKADGELQTLREHCENVAALVRSRCRPLSNLLFLCGLLHDMGKATEAFQRYLLLGGVRGEVEHSLHGAAWVWRRWRQGGAYAILCAQWLCYAIAGHHSGLPDLLKDDGQPYARPETPPEDMKQAEAGFLAQVAGAERLDELFEAAVEETKALMERIAAACADLAPQRQTEARMVLMGFAQREIYSLLIDADRWDAYCFETHTPLQSAPDAPWARWQGRLEAKLDGFPKDAPLAAPRRRIADECLAAGRGGSGVYRLCVPTGGGKTLASMRLALEAARVGDRPRVIYAAPYKAILEQTARTLRGVLADEDLILEHHGDVCPEDEERYRLLAQRWDAPLLLTTTVQWLNTLFSGRSACARRFSALRGSVLILDEVQSIPLRCWYMLNLALRYLARCADCVVVLCTATQPLLERTAQYPLCPPIPINTDEGALFRAFRRVRLVDKSGVETDAPALARQVCAALPACGSALCVMNTKSTAFSLYKAFQEALPPDVPLYCLTTSLCPAHRLALLNELRALLDAKKPVVCVATQLIEAGVDVSFGLAVRALCGLSGAAQAAGRCNRNGERPLAEIWLVRVKGENLQHLQEIRDGQLRAQTVLDMVRAQPERFQNDALSQAALEQYFAKTLRECEPEMAYPIRDGNTLLDLLGANVKTRGVYAQKNGRAYPLAMAQAFRTAGAAFQALEADTVPVLAPYGQGKELIERLVVAKELETVYALAKKAQPYAVAVYRGQLEALKERHALRELPTGWAVGAQWYDERLGLQSNPGEMNLMTI